MATPVSMVFDLMAIDRASAVFARVGAAAGAAGAESEAGMARVAGAGTKLAAGFGIAAAAVGVLSVKMAADFQTATNQLVTSAGETASNLGLVRRGLLEMAGQVGVSATELAKGMYQVESAGFHGAAGLNVMRAAAEGAKAEGAQMETVAGALTTVLNNYGRDIQNNAVKGTDFLVATVSLGKTRMEDFSASISNVLPVAKSAGIGLAEVGGAMATMTAQGISSDQAATYLRQTIVKLADQTPKAKNEMKALGLESIDVAGNLGKRGLAGTLQVLTDAIAKHMGPGGLVMLDSLKKAGQNADMFQVALSNLPPAAQTYIGALTTMVGGQKTMMGALSLTGDHMKTFVDDTAKITDAMAKSGAHVNGWEIVSGSFNQQLARVRASLGAVAIELGTHLLPPLTAFFGFLSDHLRPALVIVGVAIAAMVGPAVVGAVGALFSSLTVLLSPVVLIAAAFVGIGIAFTAAYKQSAPLRDAFDNLRRAFGVFMAAFRAADAAGGVSGFLKGIQAGIAAALPFIVLALRRMGEAMWTWIKDSVRPAMGALGDWIGSVGRWLRDNGLTTLVAALTLFARALWWWVTHVDVPLVRELGKLLGTVGGWLIGTGLPFIGAKLSQWARAFVAWVGPQIPPLLNELGRFLGKLLGWIVSAIPLVVAGLVILGASLIAWIVPRIPGLLLKLALFAASITGWIMQVGIPTLVVGMLNFGVSTVQGFIDGILHSGAGEKIGQFFSWIGNSAKNAFISGINELKSWINNNLIDNLNAVTGVFGVPAIPHLGMSGGAPRQTSGQSYAGKIARMAAGGVVPGSHDRDDVPIFATPGEVMVPKPTVAAFGGADALMSMLGFGGGGGGGDGAGGHYLLGGMVNGLYRASGAADVVRGAEMTFNAAASGIDTLLAKGARFAIDHILNPAASLAGRAVSAPPLAHDIAVGSMRWLTDKIGAWASRQDAQRAASDYGSPAGSPGGGVERWRSTVVQALLMNGLGPEFGNGVLSLINSESGGNPNAINLTDSNAAAGHPSRGLMQTIPTTFEAYRSMGLPDNIVDPLANVFAGIHYALKNYGPGMLMAGGRHGSGGGYVGYEHGTDYVPRTGPAFLHEGEAVLTAKQNRERSGGGVHVNLSGTYYGFDPRDVAAQAERKLLNALAVYAL